MTQKYGKEKVFSPGTVIISAGAEVSDVRRVVSPVMQNVADSAIYYIDFSFDTLKLGGSAFAQSLGTVGAECPTVQDTEYFANAFGAVQELIKRDLVLAGHDISAGGIITTLLEMCFANVDGGMEIDFEALPEKDLVKILFAENPGVVMQTAQPEEFEKVLKAAGIGFLRIGKPCEERHIMIEKNGAQYQFIIDHLRDVWYASSYLLDRKQSGNECARNRFNNYKEQPIEIQLPADFTGRMEQYGISADRRERSGVRAAIIREKGVNGDREMAYSLYLAGFDVKDVHMTDLISGRETLDDVNMIVYCGGFSNSDVLGSAKGWAGGFLYNKQARETLERFYARPDTLSLGICNGCQLMVELGLLTPDHAEKPRMRHNESHKFESNFISLAIPENNSVMFRSLAGSKLGIWIAHGEGKFEFPYSTDRYNVIARYNYNAYPANPNGSPEGIAGICSADGRHLAMMPHLERAIFPWQCAYYPAERRLSDEVTPWIEAFVNARRWVEENRK